jgi:hypothetical protein
VTTSPPTTDPFPWDDGIPADTIDDTPTIDSVLNPSPTDLERTNVFVDTRAAEGILDDCSADAVRRETAGRDPGDPDRRRPPPRGSTTFLPDAR